MGPSLTTELAILYRSLSRARRRQLMIVTTLMPLTAIAEMAMVAAIIPFLALLAGGPATAAQLPVIGQLLDSLGPNPLMAAVILFASAVLTTAALRLALAWISQQFAFGSGHELTVDEQAKPSFTQPGWLVVVGSQPNSVQPHPIELAFAKSRA